MSTAQEAEYQLGLARAHNEASPAFLDEMVMNENTAQEPLPRTMETFEEATEEEDEASPSITEGIQQTLSALRASRATDADEDSKNAKNPAHLLISQASYFLLRPLWIDIFGTIGTASFGVSWLVLGIYTFIFDALNVFGFNKQEGAFGALTDPVDAAAGIAPSLDVSMPALLKPGFRLMGRVFVIYPMCVLVGTLYGTLLVLIAIIVYAAFHPAEALKTFGTAFF